MIAQIESRSSIFASEVSSCNHLDRLNTVSEDPGDQDDANDYIETTKVIVIHISNAKDNRNHGLLYSQCFIRIETLCFVFDNDNNDLEVVHPQSVFSSSITGRIGIWKCWFLR